MNTTEDVKKLLAETSAQIPLLAALIKWWKTFSVILIFIIIVILIINIVYLYHFDLKPFKSN